MISNAFYFSTIFIHITRPSFPMSSIAFYKEFKPTKSHRITNEDQPDNVEDEFDITEEEISFIEPNLQQINLYPTNANVLLFFEKITKCGHFCCQLVDTVLPMAIMNILKRVDPISEPQLIVPSFSILKNLLNFGLKRETLVLNEFSVILKSIFGKLMIAKTNFNCVNAVTDFLCYFARDPVKFDFFYESGAVCFLFFFLRSKQEHSTVALVLDSLYHVLKLNNKFWSDSCRQNGEVSTWRLVCDNDIIPILFNYLNEHSNENVYINTCQLIGYLAYNNEYMFEKMQMKYFEVIAKNLQFDDMNIQIATLDIINAMIVNDSFAHYWIEYSIFPILMKLCDYAAFNVQKQASKIISELFTFYYNESIDYIFKIGTFNFFLKFLETENMEIIDNIFQSIITIFNFLSNNDGYERLQFLCENSQETIDAIYEIGNNEEIPEQIQEGFFLINSIIEEMKK